MKIAIASDLHLEFGTLSIHNTEGADVLVLAGDIVPARQVGEFRAFFEEVSSRFPVVLYVMGNHEHYGCDFYRTRNLLEAWLSQYPNIYILDNTLTYVNGYSFVGATLWTNLHGGDPITALTVKKYMSDFRIIANFSPEKSVNEFKHSLSVILNSKPNVVITHHAPCAQSIAAKYEGQHHMNGGFYSEISSHIMDSDITLWIHGHMHNTSDYVLGNTRVMCNPRGYKDYEFTEGWQLKYVEI